MVSLFEIPDCASRVAGCMLNGGWTNVEAVGAVADVCGPTVADW